MGPTWYLINPKGQLVEELAGKPSEIDPGFGLRCEEIHRSKDGFDSFHASLAGVTGTAERDDMVTHFVYSIVVEGHDLAAIEQVRQTLKNAIGVKVLRH